jgi:hypothetical protein
LVPKQKVIVVKLVNEFLKELRVIGVLQGWLNKIPITVTRDENGMDIFQYPSVPKVSEHYLNSPYLNLNI